MPMHFCGLRPPIQDSDNTTRFIFRLDPGKNIMTSDARLLSAGDDATTAPVGARGAAGAGGGDGGEGRANNYNNSGMQLYTATETTEEGVSGSLQVGECTRFR